MNLRFEEEAKKEKKKKIIVGLVRYIIELVLVVVLAWLIVNFALKKVTMIGSAMENTLESGQDVITNTFFYRFISPSRGTVIAFYPEMKTGSEEQVSDANILIRRIVGLPGETIVMKNGVIYADGEEIEEKYDFDRQVSSGQAETELKLGDDEYFVLSDKRTDLDDSRSASFTKVKRDNIIGSVLLSLDPLSLVSGPKKDEDQSDEEESA